MKFLTRKDHYEGESYLRDVFLSFGRKFQTGLAETLVDHTLGMSGINRVWVQNGFYIKLQFPFLFTRNYLDHITFDYKTGRCQYTILFVHRKSHDQTLNSWTKGMFPINSDSDPVNISKNIEVYGMMHDTPDRTWFSSVDSFRSDCAGLNGETEETTKSSQAKML